MRSVQYCMVFFAMLLIQACSVGSEATVTPEPPSPVPPTPTEEPPEPTTQPHLEIPDGFMEYQDPVVGVSIFLPESWVVIESQPGRLTYLQSYPEGKYIGGEVFEPGDTKCDLSIRPPEVDMVDQIKEMKSGSNSTIVSEDEVTLQTGENGVRLEVEGLGRSLSMVTEIDDRAVVLTCFGELDPFDMIATTLHSGQ